MFSRIILIALLALPIVASAQGLVPQPCDPSGQYQARDLLQLIQNVINAAIILATFLAIIGLAWIGFKMVVSGNQNPLEHSMLRQKLKNIVIGFVLMLSAWIIVDTVMSFFLNSDQFKNWNTLECVEQPTPAGGKVTLPGGSGGQTPVVTPTTPTTPIATTTSTVISGSVGGKPYLCSDCVDLRSLGFACKEAQCYLDRNAAARLMQLKQAYPALRVTEAMPPVVRHSAECHSNGTCVDATVSSVSSATEVVSFIDTASKSGVRAVWEGVSCAKRDEIRAATKNSRSAFCKSDSGFGHITGDHYSLYTQ